MKNRIAHGKAKDLRTFTLWSSMALCKAAAPTERLRAVSSPEVSFPQMVVGLAGAAFTFGAKVGPRSAS